MEARIEAELSHFYGMAAADYRSVGKRSSEWKLDNWKWDGDLFMARSLNPVPSECLGHQFFPVASANVTAGNSSNSSSSCSDELNIGFENGNREMEKRRRVVVVEDESNLNEKVSSLGLNLGGQGYPIVNRDVGSPEGNSAKKTKIVGSSTNRAVCQVEDCDSDLSKAKDYHRRHKVCEMHSKASRAMVGNIMQRFCQQCSRFHALQEFDEGKRSCRRRLAGHNKRRRKTNPEPDSNATALNDQSSSFLLISLLKILTNMHNNQSKEATNPDLLTHLLRTLGGNQGGSEIKNVPNLLSESQNVVIGGASEGKTDVVHTMLSKGVGGTTSRPMKQPQIEPTTCNINGVRALPEGGNPTAMQNKTNNFDLNDVYIDLDDATEDLETGPNPTTYSVDFPSWMRQGSHQSSPPQTSRTSDSASAQSPSSSTGDAQSRTDRIVFKLFGKEPNDFPLLVRAQILDWLAHSPTDIESYIRPGCVILTIYLRQSEDAWEALCYDLMSSLSRLLDVPDDTFWKMGWMCIRIQHQMAFIYNGRVVLDRSLPFESVNSTKILSVRPIAVSASDSTEFLVRGINLFQPTTRLLCALEGQYLLQESIDELLDEDGSNEEHDELQCVKFSCSVPRLTGRGFIEIEEDGGLSSSFFPFIIAEEEVCSEIRTLETSLELLETGPDADRSGEMEFINEMGWILHRSGTRSRLAHLDPNPELFSFTRFRWLMEFSMDRDWSAVVKKLLDVVLDGSVDSGDHPSLYAALLDMCLVHRAVRRNNRALVELLLGYAPQRVAANLGPELQLLLNGSSGRVLLFKPDAVGPGGLTPLHIAAGKDGSEEVLDALTEDPGTIGIQAWKNARDSTGSTPEDYARLRGHYSYIHLIQRKINRHPTRQLAHVALDIPDTTTHNNQQEKSSLEIMKTEPKPMMISKGSCKMCDQKLSYGIRGRSLPYRPAMLSMVAIAAVCVCVALLFKSCPEVLYVFGPFRWELLEYGAS